MGKLSFFLLVVFILAGCALSGKNLTESKVKDIQPNVTTRDQILSSFGNPGRKGRDSGFETWRYSYRNLAAEGWVNRDLYLIFNLDGTVQKYSYTTNQ
jgi:outer membrane protein assembly factor BamE (lipoprotein component of BamABCDE complex)